MPELTEEELPKGTKVTYTPTGEHGMVKSASSYNCVFVVYSCAGNWKHFEKYTAARTQIKELELGWN